MLLALRRVSVPAWIAAGTALAFLATTLWWLVNDGRISFDDSGGHQFVALTYRDAFARGDVFEWFTASNPPAYPPLVHLVGMVATWIGGISSDVMVMGQNLVFVPLLAAGCYGAGKLLFDARAGALAAIFALATPMLVSQFHLFMLDAPQTALVAVAVWLVLRSHRFADVRFALLAGLATGAALLTKNTSGFFLIGLLAVALLRGGWRNWRGVAAYAAATLLVAGAWHAVHFTEQLEFAGGAAVSGSSELRFDPPAFSFDDLTWYVWEALNWQLYLPLCLLVAIGIVPAVRRLLPWPARDDQMPEFLAGCVVGWLIIDLLANNDSRYTLPCLVYLAVIGTGWTTLIGRRALRRVAMGGAVAVSVVTFASVCFGVGPTFIVTLRDYDPPRDNFKGEVTVLRPNAFIVGGPEDGGRLLDVLERAHAEGVDTMSIDRSATRLNPFFSPPGLLVAARDAGISVPPGNEYAALGTDDVYLTLAPHGSIDAPPCTTLPDGDVYLLKGSDVRPLEQATNMWCPDRPDETYAAAGALAAREPDAAERRVRAELDRILEAAYDQGVREVYFEDSVVSLPTFGGAGVLYERAADAGLQPPEDGRIANLSDERGMYVYTVAPALFEDVCLPVSDEVGLLIFRGNDKQTAPYADNLYCPTREPPDYEGPLAS